MSEATSTSPGQPTEDVAAWNTLQGRFVGMFSYGSNNEKQLRARVNNPRLSGCPAFLDGYTRVFGSSSPAWGGGGVASVAKKEGARVYGCFYLMTPKEVEIVDVYECVKQGGYSKEAVMINVCVGDGTAAANGNGNGNGNGSGGGKGAGCAGGARCFRGVSTPAMTYVMSDQYVKNFVHPSPQYLTGVYRTLTSNFPGLLDVPVEVCDYTGMKRSTWAYPGPRGLPLKAFLVEVGLQELPPWTFPSVLTPLVTRLAEAGIKTTAELYGAVESGDLLPKLAGVRSKRDMKTVANGSGGSGDGSTSASSTSQGSTSAEEEKQQPLLTGTVVPEFTDQTAAIIARIASVGNGHGLKG